MITSIQNHRVKEWKKLHTKKGREKTGRFIVEGFHLVEEAKKTGQKIKEVIYQEDVVLPEFISSEKTIAVSKAVFKEISQTETPQGVIAVVEQSKQELSLEDTKSLLMIDAVQDPGNLGTMIRTADAAGMGGVVLGKGTVDLYNDKVIRATQGSLFHIPIVQGDLSSYMRELQANHFAVWATALEGANDYMDVEVTEKVAIIVGNEGAGINPDILSLADERVKIPIYGQAESLNVSIAAAIIMYDLQKNLRQK